MRLNKTIVFNGTELANGEVNGIETGLHLVR